MVTRSEVHTGSRRSAAIAARFSPEADLLISCARTALDRETTERIKALVQQDIDWTLLTELADHHQVMPLLYRNLNAIAPSAVPEPTLDHLRRFFYANAMIGTRLSDELVRILNLFAAHNILAAPYKGPALSASVYGDICCRTVGDLDVLVRRQDVMKARELLIAGQFRSTLSDEQEKHRLKVHYHLDFLSPDNQVFVELHWALTPPYWAIDLDLESLEDPLESVSLSGQAVPNLPRRELLLILCAHGAKHYWKRLRWICDISELLQRDKDLDWEKLTAQAKRLRCKRILYLGVFLAKDLLDAPVPAEVWQRVVKDSVVLQLAGEVHDKLFPVRGSEETIFDHRRFFLRTRESLRDKARHFYHDRLRRYLGPFFHIISRVTERQTDAAPRNKSGSASKSRPVSRR